MDPERKAMLKDDLACLLRRIGDLLRPPRPRLEVQVPPEQVLVQIQQPGFPDWMTDDDPLRAALQEWETVVRDGTTTWGCIVLANDQLFRSGANDHPALVAWCADRSFEARPQRLEALVRRFRDAALDNDAPPELHELREVLQDQGARPACLAVPPRWSQGRPIFVSVVLVPRDHLPGERLLRPLLPVRCGEFWQAPVVVPAAFWGQDLVRWWLRGGELAPMGYRINMVGGPGEPEARLPPDARRLLAGCSRPAGLLLAGPLLAVGSAAAAWALRGWTDFRIPLMVAFLGAMGGILTATLYFEGLEFWPRYQNLVDLYQDLWRRTGLPWTRFTLFPTDEPRGPRPYQLSMKVLGNWVLLVPMLPSDQVHVSIRTHSDRTDIPQRKIDAVYRIPRDPASRRRLLTDLKAQFRKLGEPVAVEDPSTSAASWG